MTAKREQRNQDLGHPLPVWPVFLIIAFGVAWTTIIAISAVTAVKFGGWIRILCLAGVATLFFGGWIAALLARARKN